MKILIEGYGLIALNVIMISCHLMVYGILGYENSIIHQMVLQIGRFRLSLSLVDLF